MIRIRWIIEKEGLPAVLRVAHMIRHETNRIVRMPTAKFLENVSVRTRDDQALFRTRRSGDKTAVNMPRSS
jgi:hypothetical protein